MVDGCRQFSRQHLVAGESIAFATTVADAIAALTDSPLARTRSSGAKIVVVSAGAQVAGWLAAHSRRSSRAQQFRDTDDGPAVIRFYIADSRVPSAPRPFEGVSFTGGRCFAYSAPVLRLAVSIERAVDEPSFAATHRNR
jgi:hypothetical protein